MSNNVYYGGIIIIWTLVLYLIGINIFSFVGGIILSFLWWLIRATAIYSSVEVKSKMYLAKKYDEENKEK